MSVPEQVPYREYRATGSNNSFEITFYLPDPKDLVVMVNKEIPPVGAYSIVGDSVVFGVAPNEGDLVEITRDTQLDRETEFKSYDNSFRPETINFDLDKIWLVLQESNLVDAKILARLKQEIEWRRTHDFNYDELAQAREKQLFDALKGYSETLFASANPGVFGGVTAGVVFALDKKSVQTHLEEITQRFKDGRTYLTEQLATKTSNSAFADLSNIVASKADKAYVDELITNISNNIHNYKTEAELLVFTPLEVGYTAKALDTKKIWYWNGAIWENTGLSEYDLAVEYVDKTAEIIQDKFSNSLFVIKDFYVSAGQQSKYTVDDSWKIIDLVQSRYAFDFYTYETAGLKIIKLTEKNQIVRDSGTTAGDVSVLNALATKMQSSLTESGFYRNGQTVKQVQTDFPDYYTKTYAELDCTAEGMYSKFDAIMSDFPAIMTKREIGRSVQDRPIYEYSITPKPYRVSSTSPLDPKYIKPVTIGVYACTHGNEYAGVVGLYVWVQNLLRRWRELDLYGDHRFACEFKIVPCVNPDGMAIKQRQNANMIDINRNFATPGWAVQANSGATAADQPETQVMQNWFADTNAAFFIDLHEHGENELAWLGAFTDKGFGVLNEVAAKITHFAFQNLNLATYANPEATSMIYATKSPEGTAVNYLGSVLNKDALLIESAFPTHAMLPNRPQVLREYTAKAISLAVEASKEKVRTDRKLGVFTH
ncbi:M14 family metallopeptidase [Acinetobacter thermotolerans]|uniref:M14 family metallopeptidase n=1 Tax=Acinetobacter thermotolerans TaxID=3151487 RepID=UPI00325B274F